MLNMLYEHQGFCMCHFSIRVLQVGTHLNHILRMSGANSAPENSKKHPTRRDFLNFKLFLIGVFLPLGFFDQCQTPSCAYPSRAGGAGTLEFP